MLPRGDPIARIGDTVDLQAIPWRSLKHVRVEAVRDYRLPRPERVELGRDSLFIQRDEIALGGMCDGQTSV